MADFCYQCSLEIFGQYFEDMSGLITPEEVEQDFGAAVLCEGCGSILVDHTDFRIVPPELQKKGKLMQAHFIEDAKGSIQQIRELVEALGTKLESKDKLIFHMRLQNLDTFVKQVEQANTIAAEAGA